jgi:hypothetical protein
MWFVPDGWLFPGLRVVRGEVCPQAGGAPEKSRMVRWKDCFDGRRKPAPTSVARRMLPAKKIPSLLAEGVALI